MKQHQFSFVQALIVAVGVLFFSSCNGEKIDSDLIDSITGKVSVEKITIDQEDFEMTEGESTVLTATVLPDDATDKTISWNSSKEDVVMILERTLAYLRQTCSDIDDMTQKTYMFYRREENEQ